MYISYTVRGLTKYEKIFASSNRTKEYEKYDILDIKKIKLDYEAFEKNKRLKKRTLTAVVVDPNHQIQRSFALKWQSNNLTIPTHCRNLNQFHTKRSMDGGQGLVACIVHPLNCIHPHTKFNAHTIWVVEFGKENYDLISRILSDDQLHLSLKWDCMMKSCSTIRLAAENGSKYPCINFHFNVPGLKFFS